MKTRELVTVLRNVDGDTSVGFGRVATLIVKPRDVAIVLGRASVLVPHGLSAWETDGKVDREWICETPSGVRFSIYAYKATSRYDRSLPSPTRFWLSTDPYPLSVGAENLTPEIVRVLCVLFGQGVVA
jgi:hypothetical protein